jgi:tetratricopeptide (TPR) repeat protein
VAGKAAPVVAVAAWLACTLPAGAGVFNTAEPLERVNEVFTPFQATLASMRNIGSDADTLLNRRYNLVGTLAAAGGDRPLTVEERANAGAYLIHLQKYVEAIQVMKLAEQEDPKNFLLLANLATAHLLNQQSDMALHYVNRSLRAWPEEWNDLDAKRKELLVKAGWSEKDFDWYRRAETYFKRLVLLRIAEERENRGKPAKFADDVDALFAGGKPERPVHFVGESGKWEVGKVAAAERDKLPPDAVQIVQQLLLWMPDDLRLFWLLGELYNARGDPVSAGLIFDYLVWNKNVRAPSLMAHRHALTNGLEEWRKGQKTADVEVPPAPPEPDKQKDGKDTTEATDVPPWVNFWQPLLVGFVAGLLVAFLGYWQVQEYRRRRARTLVPR